MRNSKFVLIALLVLLVVSLSRAPATHAATFTVDSTNDAVDAAPGDGVCATAAGACTLRAAIQETNALAGPDTINLPAGTYTLTVPGPGENLSATGDLDITDDLTVNGDGPASTIIDGNSLDRVLDILDVEVEVSGVTVRNGDTSSDGGGINTRSGRVTMTNCSINGNRAGSNGGGINTFGSILSLTNCSINGNRAPEGGGGVFNVEGIVVIDSSTIAYNTAGDGGGLYNMGQMGLVNSTVSGNDASTGGGGGIFNLTDVEFLLNSTISQNSAIQNGGGILNGGTVQMANTIVADNLAGNDCAGNPVSSIGHNLDRDNTCNLTQPTDLPGMSPMLGPLQNNGGPTETHALPATSPAIDTADNATCAAFPVNNLDQRGQPRPVDGDEDGIAVCDIGAYELQLGDCVEFEEPALGTEYHVGDTFVDSGVTISADTFFWSSGTPYNGGSARIENTGLAGGTGQEIAVNNINLAFDFGVPLVELELRFGEYGGNLNIDVNGDFRNFENFVDIDGLIIGGVEVSVVNGLGNDAGSLTLTGTINSFAIGGQELWIDDVCPLAEGQITIAKETLPGGGTGFDFSGDLGSFSLDDGGTHVSGGLPPGDYDVIETLPTGWLLGVVVCTGGDSDPITDGVVIHLDAGEEITCTFTNERTTAIELRSFTAQASAYSVTVAWETAAEIDNEGYNLWRAEAADGPYGKLNTSLIPAQGDGDTGASYQYTDSDVVKGMTYYYKLEDVDIHGGSTFHGPVSVTPGPYRPIYLPLILK